MAKGLLGLVVGLGLLQSLFAAIYARGLFQDGVYYLYRIAVSNGFQLVEPARVSVNAVRQAPIVALTRFTDMSLFQRGQVFTFVLLFLPVLTCAACWLIAPRSRKGWIIFPLLHVTVGWAATSFNAIGESALATSFWWCLLFMLVFRTRDIVSQILFLAMCAVAFSMHEGAFPLMAVLLVACAVRYRTAANSLEKVFLILCVPIILAILTREVWWVVNPRVPSDRAMVLDGLASLAFVYVDGHVNLPLVTGLIGCFAMAGLVLADSGLPPARAMVAKRAVLLTFCLVWLLALVALGQEWSFSPGSQVLARYHPVFLSFVLGLVMLGFVVWDVPERIWLQRGVLAIMVMLILAHTGADIAATLRWRAYVADLQSCLSSGQGLVRWNDTLVTGDAEKDMNWRLMSMEWVIPLISIAFAKDGVVRMMIDPRPNITFRPVDPNKPDQLPVLRGIDFAPYRAALKGN
jgi:hypothetical protein